MKNYKENILNKLHISMTDEQKEGYISDCAGRILRYGKYFVFVIICFQLYNIIFALAYTKGTLNTTASKVYTSLYSVLLLVSIGSIFLINYFKRNFSSSVNKIIYFQLSYSIILLLWGACVTVYDQRVSENLSVYLIISLAVAVLVYLTPIQAVLIYGFFDCILFLLLPLFADSSKDHYGEYTNLIIMTVICLCICFYRYYYDRKNYLYKKSIAEKNDNLKYLVQKDSLTGLKNRRFLKEEMNLIFKKCLNEKKDITFMMMDIDYFKNYNDKFGHLQGDECLRRISRRINNEMQEGKEFLIRYGGEEFLYIGIGVDKESAKIKGEHYNKIIRGLVMGPSDEEPMKITISIGSYTLVYNEFAKHVKWIDCVDKADSALYKAKNDGRDKFVAL